jgi:hypothetical protein
LIGRSFTENGVDVTDDKFKRRRLYSSGTIAGVVLTVIFGALLIGVLAGFAITKLVVKKGGEVPSVKFINEDFNE